MEMIQQELDRQAGELTRIARGLDAATGPDSRVELQVGRLLQLGVEQLYTEWPKEMPPGWLDERIKTQTRVAAQKQALLYLAETLDVIVGGDLRERAEQMFAAAREATPIAIATNFYEAPLIYTPEAMERDYVDLVFETHDAVLQLLQDALEI
jgi:hypothetical protein